MHQTHLDKKRGRNRACGSTNLSFFHPQLMGFKAPSQLYMEGHAGNLLICKLKADETVQLAIESQLARETNWTRKSSTIVQCQEIIDIVSDNFFPPTTTNCYNYRLLVASETPKLKKAVKNTILD